jgi:hypothetical protein
MKAPRAASLISIATALIALATLALASGATGAAHRSSHRQPTLGVKLKSLPDFGGVRPPEVNFNGDGTSFVKGIHWQSWGGKRATGTGYAYWVWPGWSEAGGSVYTRATVVAMDLGNCRGREVYRAVTWYFPSRGDVFDSNAWEENLCTGAFRNVAVPAIKSCASVSTSSPAGRATKVQAWQLSCAQARTLIAGSDAARYATGPSRFYIGSYPCGNEDAGVGTAGQITCEIDTSYFNFTIRRTH